GLEVDYIGVIIGPDLIVRNGQVITAPEERDQHDKSIRGYKKLGKANPELARRETDLIIKNTYRTLMTRGLKGCYVYCTDAETAAFFSSTLT
ncbi:DNA/RNA helicase domain-containing protein, partial [Pseudomonas aeruginosa]|uniref:DNA/RNA helicase domain-containing protein n=1 Tax=Pseudomonas aeruginosa TaxID=287 RepID=UPI001EEE1814